jgi:hypothetical protein
MFQGFYLCGKAIKIIECEHTAVFLCKWKINFYFPVAVGSVSAYICCFECH